MSVISAPFSPLGTKLPFLLYPRSANISLNVFRPAFIPAVSSIVPDTANKERLGKDDFIARTIASDTSIFSVAQLLSAPCGLT